MQNETITPRGGGQDGQRSAAARTGSMGEDTATSGAALADTAGAALPAETERRMNEMDEINRIFGENINWSDPDEVSDAMICCERAGREDLVTYCATVVMSLTEDE